MEQAYKTASKQACNKQSQRKQQFDKKAHYSDLKINDRVLVRNLLETGGPGKIRAHWEDIVHTVVGQADKNLPVYEAAPETGQGRTRTLHRNLLLPCSFLPLICDNTANTEPKRGRVSSKQSNHKTSRKVHGNHADSTGEVNEEDSSDEECTIIAQPFAPVNDYETRTMKHTIKQPSDQRADQNAPPCVEQMLRRISTYRKFSADRNGTEQKSSWACA